MKIIDCLPYYPRDSVWLALRLYRLNKYVDKFVVSFSSYTYSNKKIDFSLKPFESFIRQYEDKIIWVKGNFTGKEKDGWEREGVQRRAIQDGINQLNLKNEDIIMICDCDEIPTAEGMNYIIKHPPIKLAYSFYGELYHFNYKHFLEYNDHIKIARYDYYDRDIAKFRVIKTKVLKQFIGSTSIAYAYTTLKELILKIGSYSHIENNKYPWTDPTFLYSRFKCYRDLYNPKSYIKHEYNSIRDPLPDSPIFEYLTKDVDFTDAKELVNFSDPSVSCMYDILKFHKFKI